jgi:Tol biopolymer transport system component
LDKIVFIKTNGGYNEIWKMDLDGSNKSVLASSSNNKDPRFTPDGKKIVFSSIRNGDSDYEIYIMDSDGSNINQLTSNSVEDSHPDYRP